MKKEITAIIQARMGSTRLPEKALMDIAGKPMLWHVIERAKNCKTINSVVVATTNKENDRAIVKLAEECGVGFFTGSENDVLDRYYQTIKKFGGDIIVRISGDCPLTDPLLTDEFVGYYLKNQDKIDYLTARKTSLLEGVLPEVFSFMALEKAWKESKKPSEREHVTPYIWKHPKVFRLGEFNPGNYDGFPDMRWSVDEERDLKFVRKIYNELYNEGKIFYLDDILNILRQHPELMEINKGSTGLEGYYKSLEEDENGKI